MFLDWAGSSAPYQMLTRINNISKSAVCNIIHVVYVLCKEFVPSMIVFPEGHELMRVMQDFRGLCNLPYCAGAIDRMLMRIEKPYHWGDVYYCYKKHTAIILFVCVDAHGKFTFVIAGGAGQVGNAHICNDSALRPKIDD
eukprot:1065112-Pelagomonas_calceolata.AAC.1